MRGGREGGGGHRLGSPGDQEWHQKWGTGVAFSDVHDVHSAVQVAYHGGRRLALGHASGPPLLPAVAARRLLEFLRMGPVPQKV